VFTHPNDWGSRRKPERPMASVGLSMNNLFLKSKSPPSGKEGSEEERSRRFEGTCVLASENRSSPAKRSVGWTRSTASSACIAGRLRRITRKARECCPGVASAAARWPDMAGSEKLARVETRERREIDFSPFRYRADLWLSVPRFLLFPSLFLCFFCF
jgi:hypothetical protein